jgi:hypothetical protein
VLPLALSDFDFQTAARRIVSTGSVFYYMVRTTGEG